MSNRNVTWKRISKIGGSGGDGRREAADGYGEEAMVRQGGVKP